MRRRWIAAVAGVLVACGIAAAWVVPAVLPWAANHDGFALPGRGGLPYRVRHHDRDYDSLYTCARAGWCQDSSPARCQTLSQLADHLGHQPVRAGEVPTLFGAPRPLFTFGRFDPSVLPMAVAVQDGGSCCVLYDLSGGP